MYSKMQKRKGAESFIYVLIVGIAIFGLIGLLSLNIHFSLNGNNNSSHDHGYLLNEKNIEDTIKEGKIYYFDKFLFSFLGHVKENKKTIKIGDKDIGNTLSYRTIKEENSFEISNGLFGKSSKTFYFSTNEGKKVRISFTVNKTNRYGKLIIKINDHKVFDNFSYDGERILIEVSGDKIKDKNIIEISCESSLPKIWAPTKYQITDFKIDVLDYVTQDEYTEFELLPEEYEGLRYVEVKFNVIDTNEYAPLSFYVNNKKVFEDVFEARAKPYVVWLYKKDNLHQGINVLRLETSNNAYYNLRNIEINVHYIGNSQINKGENTFAISSKDYEFIEKNKEMLEGVIEINTKSVTLDKGISFFINGGQYTISNLRSYDKNYVIFDVDLLKRGINTIEWQTQGSYDIENIKIGVRRKG